jgi:TonB family protein
MYFKRLLSAPLLFCSLVCSLPLLAQTAPATPLPSDPSGLMLLAHDKNGLSSPDLQPWHIRGSYTFFDKDGKAEDTGVYEEWWMSPKKYKRSYQSTKFKQVEYATGSGLFREGAQEWPGENELLMRQNLIDPLPGGDLLKEFTLEQVPEAIGGVKLNCVILEYDQSLYSKVSKDIFPISCFDPTIPVLRLNSPQSGLRTGYYQIVSFQGHYLAREFRTSAGGKPRIDFKLDVAEGLKGFSEAALVPPASALPVDIKNISLKGWPIALKRVFPAYPVAAKNAQIQGSVAVKISVGKDGHVTDARATSGPLLLHQAALEAARQCVYRPFLVMGEPVEFQTEITESFSGPG